MTFNPYARQRRSARLSQFDYSQNGAYFVTICTHKKHNLFGEIIDSEVKLNEYGEVVTTEWLRTEEIRREIILDEYIVMPNHFHAIVIIQSVRRGDWPVAPTSARAHGPQPESLGSLMVGFKTAVTKRINEIRRTPRVPVWQRNYYEHVIQDETELASIREYIRFNPQKWLEDAENPVNSGKQLRCCNVDGENI
jgi:REP element-mobilizing transposase RayT